MEVGDENTWFTECLHTIRFIVTVAIVVYKGLIPVVGRILTILRDSELIFQI